MSMNKPDPKLDALLRKIRALKAKAEDKSTTEAESMAFAAKVAELLAQHGLEEAQLNVDEQPQVGHESYVHEWTSPARRALALAVCRLYMVKAIIYPKGGPWVLIGRAHNIAMVKEMASYLIKTTIRLSNEYKRNTGGNNIDFRRGCMTRIAERLDIMRNEQAKAARPVYNAAGNPGNLPALYQQEGTLLDNYMRQNFRTKNMHFKPVKQGSDAQHGRAAGDRVSLSPQVSAGSGTKLIGK